MSIVKRKKNEKKKQRIWGKERVFVFMACICFYAWLIFRSSKVIIKLTNKKNPFPMLLHAIDEQICTVEKLSAKNTVIMQSTKRTHTHKQK